MNINFTNHILGSNDDLKLILLPIAKNDSLSNVISSVANDYHFQKDILEQEFKAELKEQFSFFHNNIKVVLIGIGQSPNFIDIQNVFRSFVFQNKHKLPTNIGVNTNYSIDIHNQLIEAIVNGLLLGRYSIGLFKSDTINYQFNQTNASITLISNELDIAKNQAEIAQKIAETQLKIYDLVNNPSNVKTPKYLAQVAQSSGKEFGYDVKIFDKQDCIDLKFNALLSVNKGSPEEPVMIVMEYKPKTDSKFSLGLVGKGVTFDTGGISIKPSTNMYYMKSDMGGAAAVMGAIEMIAKLQLPIHTVAVVPSTENCVDGNSTKPGDVIQSYLGKSIEVIDTDAEGRLILADALAYLSKNYKVDSIVDFATLTGSCLRTFGYICSGLFSNDDELSNKLFKAGEQCGERMWRLPIWDAYSDDLKSDIADLKNFSGKPSAGAISAAKFLEVFIDGHPSWAHLDIAGTAYSDSEYASQKIATAYGIRLIYEYIQQKLVV